MDVSALWGHQRAFQEPRHLIIKPNLLVGYRPEVNTGNRGCERDPRKSPHPWGQLICPVRQIACEEFVGTFAAKADGGFGLAQLGKKPNRKRARVGTRFVGVVSKFLDRAFEIDLRGQIKLLIDRKST